VHCAVVLSILMGFQAVVASCRDKPESTRQAVAPSVARPDAASSTPISASAPESASVATGIWPDGAVEPPAPRPPWRGQPCEFDPTAIKIDCKKACRNYVAFMPASVNGCPIEGKYYVSKYNWEVHKGGEPYSLGECLLGCQNANRELMVATTLEERIAYACFERHSDCDGWLICSDRCRK
jgi:hypothetical protein